MENGFGGNNSMNSFNHYSFGAVGQWMMAYSLGIQQDEAGFPEVHPAARTRSYRRDDVGESHYDSIYGQINSAWKVAGPVLTYRTTVPANTQATLLPAGKDGGGGEGGRQGFAHGEGRDVPEDGEGEGGVPAGFGQLRVHGEPLSNLAADEAPAARVLQEFRTTGAGRSGTCAPGHRMRW